MKLAVSCLFAFTLSIHVAAQTKAVRTGERPAIDGALEAVWQTGAKFDAFKQVEPAILADPTVKSEGYVLYDNENIYIAFRLYQERNTVQASKARKDATLITDGDWVTVSLDPMGNGNTAFFITVNPENAVQDGTFDEYGTVNMQWDARFSSATSVTDESWIVEIEIPLTSLTFQSKDVQDWGIRLFRHYARNQEMDVSSLTDVHNPYRLTNFDRIVGLEGLNKRDNILITPYLYSQNQQNFLEHSSALYGKAGGEVRFTPSASMTILGTVNPDFAQIETDKEVINVSDLPTEYPEKRPFFTESSDFYTNAAVNTRNVAGIKAGLKIRQLGEFVKYDVTGALDKENVRWLFGHLIISDTAGNLAELTTGLKSQSSRDDYNVTAHLQKSFFEKRLVFSEWGGTINSRISGRNEWEALHNVRWLTRTLVVGWRTHFKTKYYNPNVVGLNYLSNDLESFAWVQYNLFYGSGLLRMASFNVEYDYYGLTSPFRYAFSSLTLTQDMTIHLGDALGNWFTCLQYSPATDQKFRFRGSSPQPADEEFEDAIGKFALVEDRAGSFLALVRSDNSRSTGFEVRFTSSHVRGSRSDELAAEVFWKVNADSYVKYSVAYIKLPGSQYQSRYEQVIHRLQVEYNITEKLNLRLILQPGRTRLPASNDYQSTATASNLTASWEYAPGSFVYLVYGLYRNDEEMNFGGRSTLRNDQTVMLKINKSFSL